MPITNELDKILTTAEVAAFLKINRSTVYKLIRRSKLPAFRVGTDWRFKRVQIWEWLEYCSGPSGDFDCASRKKHKSRTGD